MLEVILFASIYFCLWSSNILARVKSIGGCPYCQKEKKKSFLLLSPIHFVPLTPEQTLDSIYFPKLFQSIQSTPTEIFLCYLSTYNWNCTFIFCNTTYNMMPYATKICYNFIWVFFMQNCISMLNISINENNHKIFLMYFLP